MAEAHPRKEPGRITSFTVESSALGVSKKVSVYLPPGYDAETDRHYPVVYLLRGHQGEWADNKSSPSRKGRSGVTVAEELIMSGVIPPVILAMPPLASDDGQVILLSANIARPERLHKSPGIGTGRFADFLTQEVVPAIDRHFRTLSDRRFRGVDGFSLGGFSAVSLAMRRPDLFSSVGAFEGEFLYVGGKLPNGRLDPLMVEEMGDTFGSPPDLELVRKVNPLDLVETMRPEQLKSLSFHLLSTPPGTGDYMRVQAFLKRLAERGVENSFSPGYLPNSKHGWYWADDHLKLSMQKHTAVFAQAFRTMHAPRTVENVPGR